MRKGHNRGTPLPRKPKRRYSTDEWDITSEIGCREDTNKIEMSFTPGERDSRILADSF